MTFQEALDLAQTRGGWSTPKSLLSLHKRCERAIYNKVAGAFVECGVARGSSATILANLAQEYGRPLWLFDSFEGLPPAGAVDRELHHERNLDKYTGGCRGDYREVLDFLSKNFPRADLHVVKGWFDETLPREASEVGKIAVLHADGDWYESTRTILAAFAPLVEYNGYIILDDYGHWRGCKRATDEHLEQFDPKPTLGFAGASQAWFRKNY
jgi:hypothetical protein